MEFWTAMVLAPLVSLWFGFFVERSYRQGTTYNLIGYANRKGLSPRLAEKAVSKYFGKWDWLLLAFGFYCGALVVILHLHRMNMMLIVALSVLGGGALLKCLMNLGRHYKDAQTELS